jgi:hypothetical protein
VSRAHPVPGVIGLYFGNSFNFARIASSRGGPTGPFIHLTSASYCTVWVVVGCRTSTVNRTRGEIQSISLGPHGTALYRHRHVVVERFRLGRRSRLRYPSPPLSRSSCTPFVHARDSLAIQQKRQSGRQWAPARLADGGMTLSHYGDGAAATACLSGHNAWLPIADELASIPPSYSTSHSSICPFWFYVDFNFWRGLGRRSRIVCGGGSFVAAPRTMEDGKPVAIATWLPSKHGSRKYRMLGLRRWPRFPKMVNKKCWASSDILAIFGNCAEHTRVR